MSKNGFDALLLKKMEEEILEYNSGSWQQLSERLDAALPQTETTPSFDALLVEKLGESAFEYNPSSWEQLSLKLEPETTARRFPLKKWGIAIGTAAAVATILGLAITFTRNNNESIPVAQHQEQPAVARPAAPATRPTPPGTQSPVRATLAHTDHRAQRPAMPSQEHNIRQVHDTFTGNNIPSQAPAQVALTQPNESNPATKTTPADPAVRKQEHSKDFLANNIRGWSPVFTQSEATRNAVPKTSVAFGGGVNYGNLNTGYTAGVSVKRNISSDFFVDGTVAMMYNNNATNVAANNGPSVGGNIASRPASFESSISSPALDPMQRLYYLQINPSFGYQIEDKVALSVGGDFQQILNKREEIVQPNNSDTKIFPNFDVGITTKSEFSISPNIQAGLVYREGLNNLIKGDGGKYVNRRYFQVQFKYNLPLK